MIKWIFLALTIVNFSKSCTAENAISLSEELNDFVDLLDVDYIARLTNIYYLNDRDFQSMLEYVQSDEFCRVWTGFFKLLAIRDLGMYLTSEGIPVYNYVEVVGNFIGQPPVNRRMIKYPHEVKFQGFKGYVEKLLGSLPLNEWFELYKVKQERSDPFKSFINHVRGVNLTEFKEFYQINNECRSFVQVLRSHGIQVELLQKGIKTWVLYGKFNFDLL